MGRKRSLGFDTSAPLLDVYLYERQVGTLGQSGPDVWFKYDEWVLAESEPATWALSVRLPPTAETYGHQPTLAFFDNLLLESDTRRVLSEAAKRDQTDLPGMLGRVGAECAGAVALWPHGQSPPAVHVYKDLSELEVDALFNQAHGVQASRAQLESRQTMSGVQRKLVFRKIPSGYALPLEGAPSTVIVKRSGLRYDGLVPNELACLRLFGSLGLIAADAASIPGTHDLLEVTRYDRILQDGSIQRLHQEDLCQATGRIPARKYQYAGGPGLSDIASLIRRHSHDVATDMTRLIRGTIANVCLGNMDAHAKNFSLLRQADGALRLAPFYDIVSTEVYDVLTPDLSMQFGGSTDPRHLGPGNLERFAKDLKVDPKVVRDSIDDITSRIEESWLRVAHTVASETSGGGIPPVLERMTAHLADRIPGVRDMTIRSRK